MKLRKIFAVMSATALAASCFAINASAATRLPDVVHPDENDANMNDSYYKICAVPFFMNGEWTAWNQADASGQATITDEGILDVSYSISEGLAITDNGNVGLGMMGVMICNLPQDNFPYEISVLAAEFTTNDGENIQFESLKGLTELSHWTEEGATDGRIVIRPTDDPDNGVSATPEVKSMGEKDGFKGGTLHITLDFGKYEPETEDSSEADDSPEAGADDSSSEADDSSKDDSSKGDSSSGSDSSSNSDSSSKGNGGGNGGGGNGGSTGGSTTNASTGDGEAASDNTENVETGAAENCALALMALSVAGIVVTKKKQN